MSWEQKTRELLAQGIRGRQVDIFGIFLANSFQDVKEAGEFHEENDIGKRVEALPAIQCESLS